MCSYLVVGAWVSPIIDTTGLRISLCNKVCFKAVDCPIRLGLDFEHPFIVYCCSPMWEICKCQSLIALERSLLPSLAPTKTSDWIISTFEQEFSAHQEVW